MPPSIPPLTYGAFYHIYNRGNNRENIFVQERNYTYFLGLWWKHISPSPRHGHIVFCGIISMHWYI